MTKPVQQYSILVTGDLQTDHCIYRGERERSYMSSSTGTQSHDQHGGANLIFTILLKVFHAAGSAAEGSNTEHHVCFGLKHSVYKYFGKNNERWGIWRGFEKSETGLKGQAGSNKIWRLAETLGYGQEKRRFFSYADYGTTALAKPHNLVVINDNGLGFRNRMSGPVWPDAVKNRTADTEWIVLKMSKPLAQGDLWDHLIRTQADKLITLVSVEDMRREAVYIPKGVSWESTVLALVDELCFNTAFERLMASCFLIVSISSSGALIVDNTGDEKKVTLMYDPACQEDEFEKKFAGKGLGYRSCVAAGIAAGVGLHPMPGAVSIGTRAGLSASRAVHIEGHGEVLAKNQDPGFPLDQVAKHILNPGFSYSSIGLPVPKIRGEIVKQKNWTILTELFNAEHKHRRPLYGVGLRVALAGESALENIPFERFGALFTVDRNEIEALRSVEKLIMDYEKTKSAGRPLCIAVFGPPGAGKSFGVKEIARGILGRDVPFLEFNLSQFPENPDSLTGALHQVRDKVLEGKTPVVFWDEFDSKQYYWLQYLLAPMQDGKFQEGQITHPIGKCVFVFAGGTSYDWEHFGPPNPDSASPLLAEKLTENQKAEAAAAFTRFKLLKGPDFISRINGFLNVLGPNPKPVYDALKQQWLPSKEDICFPIRRAMLLRSFYRCKSGQRLSMDRGLISAFIEAESYYHGSRSMEKLAMMIRQEHHGEIRRSHFPPPQLVSTHVDYDAFMRIMNRDSEFRSQSAELAPFIHEYYREAGRRDGWLTPDLDKDFLDLPESYQEDNRAAARRIPEILGLIGLYAAPAKYKGNHYRPEPNAQRIIKSCLELLAEEEHDQWMAHKLQNGWVYSEGKKDEEKKKHPCLVPYCELSEKEKQKDRDSVLNFEKIIKKAGFKIVSRG